MPLDADRHPSPDLLDAFDLGVLPEAEARVLEDHLAACVACVDHLSGSSAEDGLIGLLRNASWAGTDAPADSRPAGAGPPSGYELIEPIGRGGMGVVFKARQRGLGRVVALKRLSAGLDADEQALARFRFEAEAVARLRHPGVVQVFDFGVDDGVPFLAMEYLPRGTLVDRLDAGPLRPIEAARLVELLALAVDHAHQAGILHRDLKPGNVLFGDDDMPRVADFGLARPLEVEARYTRTGVPIGTPGYMAPEQAGGRADQLGPSCDVYALGAILYECLTGRPPYRAATPLETLDLVRRIDPAPPRRVQPGVPADLETITLKCLDRDPGRRYPTAAALAEDLARYHRGEPIRARPVGPVGRLIRWARRRPSQAALALLTVLAVVGLVAGVLVHNARLRAENGRTRSALAMADANYREARAAIRAMIARLDAQELASVPGLADVRRAQLEDALGFYGGVLERAGTTDPALRLDNAAALAEAATLQLLLGQHDEAAANLGRAERLLLDLESDSPDDPEILGLRMQVANKLGQLPGDGEAPLVPLRQALGLAERLVRLDPDSLDRRDDLAWCHHNLAASLIPLGRLVEAERHLERAVAERETVVATRPDSPGFRLELAETLINLALIRAGSGRLEDAETSSTRAAGLLRPLAVDGGIWSARAGASLADLALNWGNLRLTATGRPEEALARYDEGLALVDRLHGVEPAWARVRTTAMKLHGARAQALGALGRHAEEAADWEAGLALADDSHRNLFRIALALSLAHAGDHVRAAAEADALDAEGIGGIDDLYNLACIAALCATAATNDPRLDPESRAAAARVQADLAIDRLARCSDAGYFLDPAVLARARTDLDLISLADRSDFRRLLDLDGPSPLDSAPGTR